MSTAWPSCFNCGADIPAGAIVDVDDRGHEYGPCCPQPCNHEAAEQEPGVYECVHCGERLTSDGCLECDSLTARRAS